MDTARLRIAIVGGVAGGASAATRARRMNEDAEIILFEKDEYVSFANCGLPYYIGGEIEERAKLLVATSEFLRRRFRLDVRTRQEVQRIDREAKTLTVLNHETNETYEQAYDKLILAPGASPLLPPLDGADAKNVFTLRNMADTDAIKLAAENSPTKRAVVVGSGFIGLEMVEQLVEIGFQTSLAELQPQILPMMDPEMAKPLEETLRSHNVSVYLGDGINRVLTDESGTASGVELQSGTAIEGDLVILGLGVRPNVKLAEDAGLKIGSGGGIATDETMLTNDPDIYAVGDAVEYIYGPTGQPMRIALAGPANRTGRLAGEHAATGKSMPAAPVLGTSIVRVFDCSAALTGLTAGLANRLGVAASSVTVVANDHAGYFPGATPITLKLTFDPQSGKILGAQAVGGAGVDKRIDVIATAMAMNGTVRDLTGLDLAYAPPFGSAKDPVHLAAFAACNQLDGFETFLDAAANLDGKQVVDVRTADEVAKAPLAGAKQVVNIPLDDLRDRIGELDPKAETVVSCGVGLRAHVAARILLQSGFSDVKNLSGGSTVRNRAVRDD
jgi:NADPH-dependent 2,4-dienoyl-CoA reductase/sulfur reductase-like enzyme/rhodanese-related sulfurtransferase